MCKTLLTELKLAPGLIKGQEAHKLAYIYRSTIARLMGVQEPIVPLNS